jgi:hypothetical protein
LKFLENAVQIVYIAAEVNKRRRKRIADISGCDINDIGMIRNSEIRRIEVFHDKAGIELHCIEIRLSDNTPIGDVNQRDSLLSI